MTGVNWGLGVAPDIGGNALAAFQQGRQVREESDRRNALLDLQRQQEQRLQQQQQTEQRRADLPLMERLLTDVTPENWGQRVQIAQQYGVDTSQLPQAYDPAWVQQQLATVKLLNTPQGQEALSGAGKQAMDMGYRPGTEQFNTIVRQLIEAEMAKPYTGSQGETRLYTPQIGGGGQVQGGASPPAPGAVEDGYRFKGGDPADPASWEPVSQGGPTLSASGGFPGH